MNLLIVDDEYYTVENLRMKIEEKRPEFEKVFCAYNLKHAMEYFEQYEIGVMLCDVEMPGGSGLDLLEKIRERNIATSCVFLTAYANFDYISRAMKLSSCDYLLKPVDDDELFCAIDKAAANYMRHMKANQDTLYADYWRDSELSLMEGFWQELMEHSISSRPDRIEEELKYRKLDMKCMNQKFILLGIQCNMSAAELSDQSILEFTLKNITREYFYFEKELPVVVRMSEYIYILLLPEIKGKRSQKDVVERCQAALSDFVPYFPVPFNFFVADQACEIQDVKTFYRKIRKEVFENVAMENHVFDLSEPETVEHVGFFVPIPEKEWEELVLKNSQEELLLSIDTFLDAMRDSGMASRESLVGFYYSFIHMLFDTINKDNDDTIRLFHEQIAILSVGQKFSSLKEVRQWAEQVLQIYSETAVVEKNHTDVVAVVKDYIHSHIYEDLTRETLASIVYLNADYLSHIFKKETGYSLTNYVIEERIKKAKQLLRQNNMSIRDIAIACGFQNISYFSRQFKKSTGMTPREFRN